jgi:recombination protein RecA
MADQSKELKNTLAQIEKEFGKGAIMALGATSIPEIRGIHTGSIGLDIALGGKGIPRGRIVEIYGPESSGKTTLALHAIANAQKAGGVAAFIDAEHALDPSWAKRIGVNIEELLVSQPSCGEEALKIAEMLVKSNAVDIIVIDSVAALVPKNEVEGDIGDSHVGLQARLMSQALRILNPTIAKTNTCMVFINQIRLKIGVMFGNPETTSGGLALRFYASVRLEIRKITGVKDGEEVVGSRVRVKVVKNKVAPPFRQAEFDLMYDRGINWEDDLLELAVEDKLVEKSGAWFVIGTDRMQGREKVKEYFREHPAVVEKLKADVLAKHLIAPLEIGTTAAGEEPPEVETPAPTPTRRGRQPAAAAVSE